MVIVLGRRMRVAGCALAAILCGPAGAEPLPPARPFLVDLPLPPEAPPPQILGGALLRGRDLYFPLAAAEARQHGLPPEVADAVMRVESGYDPGAVGGVGERGLMQVLPSTAAMLGFRGPIVDLADPATNIRLGVRYLSGAWRLAGGDLCRTLMKYRAGHAEERMSALSVAYCRRAKAHLAALGSPLGAGAVPAADLGDAPRVRTGVESLGRVSSGETRLAGAVGRGGRAGRRGVRTASVSKRFWQAHLARVRAIEARLPWKRGGIMAGG